MAASTKNVRSSAKEDIKQQEIKQAVVIADNFNDNFSPLTFSKPAVLLTVVNGTLLDYVLQSLEECGVQEIFLFCGAHNQQIRSYVSASKWSKADSPMSVVVISSSSFMSMGDILRDLDTKALIRSDFILIRGDVIFNFELSSILDEHKKRRQEDKACALTVVYRTALPSHKTRCMEDDFLVAVESESKKIRYYQRLTNKKPLNIPLEVFQENEEVSIHYDLLDTHISICSPCVPPLFSDNFDYESLDDFVKGLLVNEELLGNSMFIHIVQRGYGASLSNFYMYDAVSQDILSRWTYPVVPDLIKSDDSRYSYSRHNIYKADNVDLGRNCILKQKVLIGDKTVVGENAYIVNSVIGKNCTIGKNVEIRGSYLWSNVTIGDNCKLDTCLLSENVTLRNNVAVKPGCILGSEVVIGDNIVLEECTKLQSQASYGDDNFQEDDFGEEKEAPKEKVEKFCDPKLVGENGHGFLCISDSLSDDEEEDVIVDVWGKKGDVSADEEDDDSASSGSVILSQGDMLSEDSDGAGDAYDNDTALFYAEVMESLQRGIEEKVKCENLILEINSSKHAYNVTMKEVNTLLTKVLLRVPLENKENDSASNPSDNPLDYMVAMRKHLFYVQPLLSNYIKSSDSQLDCLKAIEDFMRSNEQLAPAIVKVMHHWYDKDILSEPVIIKWYESLSADNDNIKKLVSSFVRWLQEADEESSED